MTHLDNERNEFGFKGKSGVIAANGYFHGVYQDTADEENWESRSARLQRNPALNVGAPDAATAWLLFARVFVGIGLRFFEGFARAQRQMHGESRAFADGRMHVNGAFVTLHQMLDQK